MPMATEEEPDPIDRISGLPEPVLHHILFFLTKDEAARTSTFSKSWRHVHSTRPKLILWEKLFAGDNNAFLFRVNATLQAHLLHNLPIERLYLGFSTLNPQSIPKIEKFAPILSTMRVKELFFLNTPPVNDGGDDRGLVPNLPFEAFALDSLQYLLLDGCNLFTKRHNTLPFSHLRKLRLRRVSMDEILPNKILSICPLLRSFRFEHCTGWKTINVVKEVSRNLHRFTVINKRSYTNQPDRDISIDAPQIEKIKIVFSKVRLAHSETFVNLKTLHLVRAHLTPASFNNAFPSLESLELLSCCGLDASHLQIDAPKLKRFTYAGDSVPDIVLENHLGDELSCEIELSVPLLVHAYSWFVKLRRLLVALSRSKITLSILNLLTEQEDDRFLLPDSNVEAVVVEELQLGGHVACFPRVLKGLLRVCHPRNLGHYWYLSSENVDEMRREEREVVEYLYARLDKRGDDESLQELDAVCYEVWLSCGQYWCPVEDTEVPDYVPPDDRNGEMTIRLGLDWRGHY